MDYFKHKYYLTHNNIRVAHVHIVGGKYTVCGHYKRFPQFKRRTFDKAGFDEFVKQNYLVIEQ